MTLHISIFSPLFCFSAFDKPLYAKMIEYKTKKVIIRPSHNEDEFNPMTPISLTASCKKIWAIITIKKFAMYSMQSNGIYYFCEL